MAKQKPWQSKWIEGARLGSGGQGIACLVRRADATEEELLYVLKLLKSQNDLERRARMYREVAALRTLSHEGIPNVIDTNADDFKSIGEPLYLVTEYIPGPTLESRISNGHLTREEAIYTVMKLADIVRYCHTRNVIHRDIKPDNIVLRHGKSEEPFLLDFGQSFNLKEADSRLTETNQQIGNRFLSLPELQLSSSNKRDPRSDITQLCGILLFSLTGQRPVSLLDESMRLPHQRSGAAGILNLFPSEVRSRLNRCFDDGFSINIEQRFQSAESLSQSLNNVLKNKMQQDPYSEEDAIKKIRQRLDSPNIKFAQAMEGLLAMSGSTINSAVRRIPDMFNHGVGWSQTGYSLNLPSMRFEILYGLFVVGKKERTAWTRFRSVIAGSELVVLANPGPKEMELFRTQTRGNQEWEILEEQTLNYLLKTLSNL